MHQNNETFRVKRLIYTVMMLAAIIAVSSSAALAQTTDQGAEIYDQSCSRCHKADGLGEPGKFPPLTGNPDAADKPYVVDVVTNGLEGRVILGETYDRKMPAFDGRLTPEEIDQVSDYVVVLSGGGATTSPTTIVPLAPGNAVVGDDLFRGGALLSGGGTACIACHSAGEYDRLGGPGLGIDLNSIIEEFGTAGFISAITDPVVDPMIAVFGDHPITEQEANDLAAYLETASNDVPTGSSVDLLTVLGIFGFGVLILITALVIRGPQHVYVEKLRSTR
jgi:mono/diheme cytochrome c family protein